MNVMTKHNDDISILLSEHYAELQRKLIKTEDDKDIFQDTVVYLLEHPREFHCFVAQFVLVFRLLAKRKFLEPENVPFKDVYPDRSEPYHEETTEEKEEDFINLLQDAISQEKNFKGRPKKSRS